MCSKHLRGRQRSNGLSSSSHRQDSDSCSKKRICIYSWFKMVFVSSAAHMCEQRMCLRITHPDVQTESRIHKIVFYIFLKHFCVSRVCSTPCVTNLWSSCPTPAPAAQFSTSRRTTSSSSRLWCTKRLSSYRSFCLDTTWSVCAECQMQCGCWMRSKLRVYVSCFFWRESWKMLFIPPHTLKQKIDLNPRSYQNNLKIEQKCSCVKIPRQASIT